MQGLPRADVTRRRRLARVLVLLGVVAAVLSPAAALAQDGNDEGVLVRVNGDAELGVGETASVVVVVKGDLALEGTARVVVVVDGTATLTGAEVETLVVVRGTANLENGTVVTGDVFLTDSTLNNDGSAEVRGSTHRDFEGFLAGFWVIGILLALGLGVLAILGALVFAGVAPDTARSAGTAIRHDLGKVVLSGLGLWILVPLVAGLLIFTVVGIPTTFAVWFGVLPIMGFLGYLVSGIWLGELLVAREGGEGHPYLAGFLGTLILVAIGWIPAIGALVGLVAGFLGSGALALLGWRNFRNGGSEAEVSEPTPADPSAEDEPTPTDPSAEESG